VEISDLRVAGPGVVVVGRVGFGRRVVAGHAGGGRDLEEAIRRSRAGLRDTLDQSPYVLGSVALGLLVERYGMSAVRALLQRLGEGRSFQEAFQDTFRTGPASFEQTVRDFVTRGY
jgi:hypothetical protein